MTCRANAKKQRGKRAAANHLAAKRLPPAFAAWRERCAEKATLSSAMQLALSRWMGACQASAFATWRAFVEEHAALKDKLQHAVAIMRQARAVDWLTAAPNGNIVAGRALRLSLLDGWAPAGPALWHLACLAASCSMQLQSCAGQGPSAQA